MSLSNDFLMTECSTSTRPIMQEMGSLMASFLSQRAIRRMSRKRGIFLHSRRDIHIPLFCKKKVYPRKFLDTEMLKQSAHNPHTYYFVCGCYQFKSILLNTLRLSLATTWLPLSPCKFDFCPCTDPAPILMTYNQPKQNKNATNNLKFTLCFFISWWWII